MELVSRVEELPCGKLVIFLEQVPTRGRPTSSTLQRIDCHSTWNAAQAPQAEQQKKKREITTAEASGHPDRKRRFVSAGAHCLLSCLALPPPRRATQLGKHLAHHLAQPFKSCMA
ncbi:unnamed protein product, partial [Amoebophrya sp. A25]|eukprot:GSA25T00024626001.1